MPHTMLSNHHYQLKANDTHDSPVDSKPTQIKTAVNTPSYSKALQVGIDSKRVITRTSLQAARNSVDSQYDQSYFHSIEQYLNDPFFDIVNNKKSTKKNRETNYIKSTTPDAFMDFNFYKKCKDKQKPMDKIVPCHWIPQTDFKDIHISHDDAKYINVLWNQHQFTKYNPDTNIDDIIAVLRSKWPNSYIKYWEDHCLHFIAICGYNIDVTIKELEEYTTRRAFRLYTAKIQKENGNGNNANN